MKPEAGMPVTGLYDQGWKVTDLQNYEPQADNSVGKQGERGAVLGLARGDERAIAIAVWDAAGDMIVKSFVHSGHFFQENS